MCAQGTQRRRLHLWGACDPGFHHQGCHNANAQKRMQLCIVCPEHSGLKKATNKNVATADGHGTEVIPCPPPALVDQAARPRALHSAPCPSAPNVQCRRRLRVYYITAHCRADSCSPCCEGAGRPEASCASNAAAAAGYCRGGGPGAALPRVIPGVSVIALAVRPCCGVVESIW